MVTWYWRWKPPTLATSATPRTWPMAGRRLKSWKVRSSSSALRPEVSTRAYWKLQPMLDESGPNVGRTPSGSRGPMELKYSRIRLRAQYGSTPSSKMTYTKDIPNIE